MEGQQEVNGYEGRMKRKGENDGPTGQRLPEENFLSKCVTKFGSRSGSKA